jgi:hypothetical protein
MPRISKAAGLKAFRNIFYLKLISFPLNATNRRDVNTATKGRPLQLTAVVCIMRHQCLKNGRRTNHRPGPFARALVGHTRGLQSDRRTGPMVGTNFG